MRPLSIFAACVALVSWPVCAQDIEYRLRPGDDPWRISHQVLASPAYWSKLVRHNGLNDATARRLPVGSVLRIPADWLATREAEVLVLAVHRDALLQRGTQTVPLQVGDQLRAGDVLRTGAEAAATLRIEDGSRVLVRAGSEVTVEQAERHKDGVAGLRLRLQLLRGAVENRVQPVAPGGRFEIRTPSGIGAVRGTDYRVSASAQRTTSEVLEGRVGLRGERGADVPIAAGQGSIVERGQATRPAVPLLPAPDLAAVPALAERLPIDLPIPPVTGAVAYRTQVAADEAFTQVLSDVVTEVPRVRVPDVEDGARQVRVRAIDPQGLEGRAAQHALRVHARPEPPLLLEPAPAAALPQPQPTLRWTVSPVSGRQVWVQVARDDTFGELLAEERVPDRGEWRVPVELLPGRYRWRLKSIDVQRGEGPWGDVQSFERVLAPPEVQPPVSGPLPVVLRWQRLSGAERYQVRLMQAGETRFAQTVAGEQAQLEGLAPGDYDVQVQAVAADGHASPWSAPQRFTVPQAGRRCPWWLLFLLPFWWV